MTEQETYADKIAKLLRKAESTNSTAEAEALIEKAQQLMTKYAITEELIARAAGEHRKEQEKIVEDEITYAGIYHMALYDIGAAIARNNSCRVLIRKRAKSTTMYIVGFESDVRRVKMLDASVQIQATGAMMRWAREQNFPSYMTAMDKYKQRRQFLFGFASGLNGKLAEANRKAQEEATAEETDRVGDRGEAEQSVALVIRDKKERVQDWVDEKYGKTLRTVSRSYASGGFNASNAGHEAGRKADLGGKSVRGGSKGELNR